MKYIGFPRPTYPLAARLEPAILGPSVNSSKIIADSNRCQKIPRLRLHQCYGSLKNRTMEHYSNILEFYCANKYSILFDVLSTIIGAFLGFYFAWRVYRKGERRTIKINLKNEKIKAYNTLKRFSLLLDSVVKKCMDQNVEFNAYSKKLEQAPLTNHLLPRYLATNDRSRLTKSDHNELYLSFMMFDIDNANKIKDYSAIFNNADFIYFFYNDLFSQQEKHMNFAYNELKTVSDKLLNIIDTFSKIQIRIQSEYTEEFIPNKEFLFLQKYKDRFNSLKVSDFADFALYRDKFLRPLHQEFDEYITEIADKYIIGSDIASALTILQNRELNALEHAKILLDLNNRPDIDSALKFFESISEKIKKINEPFIS